MQPYLAGALLSTVNLAEVTARMIERGYLAAEIQTDINELGVVVMPFSEAQVVVTATLRAQTRHLGLSLGDRACLALALERGAKVLTADKPWQALGSPHHIELIR